MRVTYLSEGSKSDSFPDQWAKVHGGQSISRPPIPNLSLTFATNGNRIWIASRISTDELFQTLSYCQGESYI